MSEISEAVDEIMSVLEKRFNHTEGCEHKVLESLLVASTLAICATNNEECSIEFSCYKSVFKVEQSKQ